MADGYIICATARSGSTLLCDLLASTHVAGKPDSFFMADPDPQWVEEWGLPVMTGQSRARFAADYLDAALRAGRGDTPIFGLRLMQRDLPALLAMIDAAHPGCMSDRARLQAAFGTVVYVHLTRADKLAQAVSLVRAQQTGLWHVAPDGTEIERLAPPSDPTYDFARIAEALAAFEAYDAAWTDWFAAQDIAPLRIDYERLSVDPAGAVRRICRALGVSIPDAVSLRPGVARLSDAVNCEWIERFRHDRQRRQKQTAKYPPAR